MTRTLAPLFFSIGTFCVGLLGFSAPSHAKKLSFRAHVYPILQRYCLNCHKPKKKKGKIKIAGKLNLSRQVAYKNLVDVQSNQAKEGYNLVTPGDVSRSYMIYKMLGQHKDPALGGKGKRMPPKKALANWRIRRIIDWVKQGAKK